MNESPSFHLRGGLWYLAPTVVAAVVPLVTLPIFTRVLSAADYGVWALAVAYGVVASGVAGLGLAVGYERNYFQHDSSSERGPLLYSVLACVLTATTVVGAATWMWQGELAASITGSAADGPLLVVAFCANAVAGLKALYLLYFKNQRQARAHAMFSIDETVLGALLSLAFVVWLRWGPMGLLAGQLAAGLTVLVLAARRAARDFTPGWSWPMLKDALAISLPLTPRVLLGVLGSSFDKYLIGQLSTVGAVGIYAIGQRLAHVVFQFITAVGNVFTPVVYQRMLSTSAEARESVGSFLTPFAWISAGVALTVGLFAEEAIAVLTTGEFAAASPIVSLLALSYGLMFFGKVPQLIVARRTALTTLLMSVSLLVTIGISLYAVPRWGAVGAACGTLTAGVSTTLAALAIGQRVSPVRWERTPLLAAFGIAGMGCVAAAVWTGLLLPYSWRLVLKIGVALAFLAMGWRLGFAAQSRPLTGTWAGSRT